MAITKVISIASLSMEVQSGVDLADDPIYTKKTFSNVKTNADPTNVFDVAEAIKDVFSDSTGDYFVNESSTLSNI